MSSETVELIRRAYRAVGEAYETGDLGPVIEEFCHPDVVFSNEAVVSGYPDRGEWLGREGVLRFGAAQMEAFKRMWIKPLDFIDAGDRVVVPLELGGHGRHTDIEIKLSVTHLLTVRDGRVARIDVYERIDEALAAAGVTGAARVPGQR